MAKNTLTCPACGVEERFDSDPIPLHEVGQFVCNACSTRVVFGKVIPRIVVEGVRDAGRGWIRVRFQDPKTKKDLHVHDLDPITVVRFVKNLLSLVTL